MKLVKRIAIVVGILLLLIILAVAVIHMPAVQMAIWSKVQDYLGSEYNVRVEADRLNYSLFSGLQLELNNVIVYGGPENKNKFATAEAIRVQAPLSIIWSSDKVVEKIQLINADVDADYPPNLKEREAEEEEDSGSFEIKEIDIDEAAIRFEQYRIKELNLDASLEENSLVIEQLKASANGANLEASGRINDIANLRYDLNFSLNGDASIVSELVPEAPKVEGPITASGKIGGAKSDISVQGDLKSSALRLERSSPFHIDADYQIDLADKVQPYQIQLRWTDFPLASIQKFVPQLKEVASLSNGTLVYKGATDPFAAEGSVETQLRPGGSGSLPITGTIQGTLASGSLILPKGNTVKFQSSTVTFSGQVQRNSLNVDAQVRIGTMSDLAFLNPDLKKVPGAYRVNANVQGPFKDMTVQADIEGAGTGLSINANGMFRTGPETIDAAVNVRFDGRALRRFDVADVEGDFEFNGNIAGAVKNPKLDGVVRGNNVVVQGAQIGTINADLNSDGRTLTAKAGIPKFDARLKGSYVWKTGDFQVDGEASQLKTEQIRALLPDSVKSIRGTISARFQASGNAERWKQAKAEFTVQSAQLEVDQLPIEIKQDTVVKMEKGVVNAKFRSQIGTGSADIDGTYRLSDNQYTVSGNLENIDLSEIRPFVPQIPSDVTGKITASIEGAGNAKEWQDSNIKVQFQEAFLTKSGLEIRIEKGSSLVLQDRFLQADVKIALPQGEFIVQGRIPAEGTTGADLKISGQMDLGIASMIAPEFVFSGKVNLDLRVEGNLKDPRIFGTVQAQNFMVQMPSKQINLRGESLSADFAGKNVQLAFTGDLNSAGLKIDGRFPLAETERGKFQINLTSFDLSSLAADSNITGAVSASIQGEGTGFKPEAWTADVQIKPENIVIEGTPVESTEALKIHLAQQRLTIEPFQMKAGDTLNISIDGSADLQNQTLQAQLKTKMDLIFLRNFVSGFSGSGELVAEVNAVGELKNPQLSGLMTLNDGFIRVPGYPFVIEEIQLRAPFDKNQVRIEKLNARMGGGTIQGSGGLNLENFKPSAVNISIVSKNVGIRYPGDLRAVINTDLKITSKEQEFLISGNVDVVRSIYRDEIDYRDRLVNSLLSQRRQLAAVSGEPSRINLDITLKTVEDFRMNNNLARIRAIANLEVKGNTSMPRLLGRVQIRDGSLLFFQGNEFVVERGNVDFFGGREISPVFDIVLVALIDNRTPPEPFQTSIDQYEVEVRVSGSLDDIEDTVQSYPPLDEQQIYSLILTGGTNSTLAQAGSKVFQQELAAYFAGQIFFGAPQKLGEALGLTRVEIQPDFVSAEEDPTARLVVGKELTSQLGLVYSVSLADTEDQTWIVNYRLARNFSLRFVDQTDEPNTLGLRHSLRFGPGQAALRSRRDTVRSKGEEVEEILFETDVAVSRDKQFEKIDELEGKKYDYWRAYDESLDLKKFLQEQGYLFPDVSFEELSDDSGKMRLKFTVNGRGKRSMVFNGYTPSKDRLKKYREWWREGFSEQSVLTQIREDLLEELWKEKFLKAEVEVRREELNDSINHVFDVTTGTQYSGVTLKFQGAEKYTSDDLEDDLEGLYGSTSEMIVDAFHRFHVLGDRIEALYIQKGFMDTETKEGPSAFRSDGTAEKVIIVEENQQAHIQDLEVANGEGFPSELLAELKAVPGSFYTPQAVSEDLIRVTEFYEQNGYPNVDVNSEIVRKRGDPNLLLRYDLKTGKQIRIGSIRIVGNYSTRRSVIEKRLMFEEGDLLVRSELYDTQRKLYNTRIFQLVRVEATESDSPEIYDVTIDLKESKKYRFTYGLRYDSENNLGGDFLLEDTRLFGTAQSISYFTRANSVEQSAGFTYFIPSIYGLKWDTLASLRYEREDFDIFRSQRVIFNLQKQFPLWGPFVALGEYGFKRINTREKNPDPDNPFVFDETDKISELTGTLFADTRDDPINAKRGYFVSLENSYAPSFLKGDIIFTRLFYQFFYFKSFGRTVWANGFRIGAAFPDEGRLIIDERFRGGGASTVRGFKLNQLGPQDIFGVPDFGEGVIIINQEIRVPVYKWIGAVAFYDVGNVFLKASDMSFGDLRHTLGLGLRVDTPFGVGRFDVGFNLNPEGDEARSVFHFGIGQAF